MNSILIFLIFFVTFSFAQQFVSYNGYKTSQCNLADIETQYFLRVGGCWDNGDLTHYYTTINSSTYSIFYGCNNDCTAHCNSLQFSTSNCYNQSTSQANDVATITSLENNVISADVITAYFPGDSTCDGSNLSEFLGMSAGFCFYEDEDLGISLTYECVANNTIINGLLCHSDNCTGSCEVVASFNAGDCVFTNHTTNYKKTPGGYVRLFCGSFAPPYTVTSTSSTSSTSTTGTNSAVSYLPSLIVTSLCITWSVLLF